MKTLIEKALKSCDQAEVNFRDVYSTTVTILLGNIKNIESEKKTEVALRMVKDGKMGTAIATSLEDESIISRAIISLENQTSEASAFPNAKYEAVQSSSEDVKKCTTQDLVNMAFDLSNRFKAMAEDVGFGVQIVKTLKTVKLCNSNGFDGEYDYTNVSVLTYTLSKQGFYSTMKEFTNGFIPEITDEDLSRQLMFHRLGEQPVEVGNEKMPVIFSGTAMGSLMLRVLGGVSGGNITKNVSPIVGKLGEKLFSDIMTIRDDATMPYGVNTFAFDDEGTPAQNTVLYDKGVLKNYLTSVSHAEKLGTSPTGNAIKRTLFSKEIEDAPSVYDSNLIIEGDSQPDDDIIKGVKRGLYITGVMGAHTGNINQGEFSMNISSGFLIENGTFKGKVKGAMIAGNIYDLFKGIEAIGTKMEPMRSIFYHMGYSPMVKFAEVNIIGK
ncbi:MAG TPA: hypothetical protein DCS67_00595 [Clostridiales bacterium UBA8960]|nr:hypothetical protein [Clostridiales bacterium UBA8960]